MKMKLDPIVKEQMKFTPEEGHKKKGNTAQSKEWINQKQKSTLRDEIGYMPNRGRGMNDNTQHDADAFDGYRESNIEYMTPRYLDTVNNNPQRNSEDVFDNYAQPNMDYNYCVKEADYGYGFRIVDMDPSDNEYTAQHATIFYDTVTREDKETGRSVTGFLERGNVLDRI